MKRSLFLILLACLLWLTGCSCTRNATYKEEYPTHSPPYVPEEPATQTYDFDFREAKVTKKDCVTVYDFDFCLGSLPVYGLAAEYHDKLFMLLVTESPITGLSWSEKSEVCYDSSSPDGLSLNIEAEGEEYWYALPLEAASQGYFTVTYEE